MELTFIKEENDTFYIEYSKLYNGVFVERAYTNFQIDGRGVKRFERVWLIVEDLGETEIYISTAPKAILALLDMEDVYGKTIENISLCYYFDPQNTIIWRNLARQSRGGKQFQLGGFNFKMDTRSL